MSFDPISPRAIYAEDALPISQIAWLLGFREPSGFSHAFKRWTGTTPRAARQRGGRLM